MNSLPAIEPLESRIAPAVTIVNPIFDITAGIGKTGATIDLNTMVDGSASYRTLVEFTTNYILPGTDAPAKIVLELFDDKAPLSVQNFLSYVNGKSSSNYDGSYFHRIADFGAGSGAGTDIIQAGGFDVSNIFKHIPTGPTVHNEYNEADPELLNVRGTLSMAKTAISPHTGTSEWFINLTDNSTILGGTNNGGYTVFGVITQGLDVIDAIGAANKISLNQTLSDVPVQESYAGGVPTGNQLFQIVDAKVISPGASDADGHSFSQIVSVTQHGTSTPSDLLTATVDSNNQLKLKFKSGATGVADVTVMVSKDGDTVAETFTVTIKPNLITELSSHNLPSTYVPGDKGVAKVKVTNNTGGVAKGPTEVRLYLSEVIGSGNNIDPLTFAVDEADQLLATKTVSLNLGSGKSATIPVNFTVQHSVGDVVLQNGKQYVVIAEAVGAPGGVDQLFTDDDSSALRSGHNFALSFGAVGGRANVPLTILGPEGQPLTFRLTGGGTGTVTVDSEGHIDLSITGTGVSSVLSVKTPGTAEYLEDVTISSAIGSVKFGSIGLHGHFSAAGGAKSITFGDLGDADLNEDRDFSINAFPIATQKLSLVFGDVNDYSVTSSMPISKITAQSWLNDEAATSFDQIFTPALGKLQVTGDLEADVLISTDAKVNNITVGGAFRDASIKSIGDIGVIKLGSLSNAEVFAGLSEVPDNIDDFVLNRSIGTFTVTGTVSESVIAAARFNSIVLGNVDTAAGAEGDGIYADAIKSYLRKPAPKITNLDAAGTFDASQNYAVHIF